MNNDIRTVTGRPTEYRRRIVAFVLSTASVAGLTAACAGLDEPVVLATPETDAAVPPPLAPVEDAGGDAIEPEPLMCLATECPAPFATCDSSDPTARPPFKCQHNLLTDSNNCGACGHACEEFYEFGVKGVCYQGRCEPQCDEIRRDCNGLPDDGCETFVQTDRNNCGQCGNVCPDGVGCNEGKCGCPPGMTDCGGYCTYTDSDDFNCGACRRVCRPQFPPPELPPNTDTGCVFGKCDELKCVQGFADCNGDIKDPQGDGCEVEVERPIGDGLIDPEHCGACDKKCAPGVECMRLTKGDVVCGCRANETRCQTPGNECVDISTDPKHCGLCNHACPFVDLRGVHQIATCVSGICGTECEPGWADCNGNPADGCETNISYDGANCGACGNRCNSALGQPCVEGRCLTAECDGGEPVTR